MPTKNEELLFQHVAALLNLFLVNEHRFPSAMGKMRYNPLDFQTLRHIKKFSGCRGSEIATALSVAPTTQQSSLDRLIRRGLITKSNHSTDLRSKVYHLTDDGELMHSAIYQQDIKNMSSVLSALTKSEQALLLSLFNKISDKHNLGV